MALTVANECKAAALQGICTLLNSGLFKLQASGPTTLATLTFGATAFGTATTASPSVALSNAITGSSAPTAGTISLFRLETSGAAVRINGTVSTIAAGTGDIQVTDNVIPSGIDSVTCDGGLSLTLQIT